MKRKWKVREKKKLILLWNNVDTREMKSSLFHEKYIFDRKMKKDKKSSWHF